MNTAEYDLYKITGSVEKENEGMYRARLVSKGTKSTDDVVREITMRTSFNSGDVRGVLQSITDVMVDYLGQGYDVQLGDIGYFSVSLTSPVAKRKKDINARSVWFKRLNFRGGRGVLRQLEGMIVKRVVLPRAVSAGYTLERKKEMLCVYLETHPFITRAAYAQLTQSLKNKAINDLNVFIEEGWLRKFGSGRTVVYYLSKEQE